MQVSSLVKSGSVILLILTIMWLVVEVIDLHLNGEIYLPNQESDFKLIKTEYGNFPITINKISTITDGTELSFTIINPYVLHFAQAEFAVEVSGVSNRKTLDLVPNINIVKLMLPPLERGANLKISLVLNKIYFK